MATNYIPLDEAAKTLGVSPDRLVELRSEGQVRGFRDGASWKFPADEIARLKDEGLGGTGSDLGVGDEAGGSDVALVARQGADGSDVHLVANRGSGPEPLEIEDSEDDLRLSDEESVLAGGAAGSGGLEAVNLSPHDSGADVLGDLDLVSEEKGGTGDIIQGDSDPHIGLDGGSGIDDALSDDDDLVIADDDDDLVLAGGGSDISIAGDSGINLMSPSDSGLSLESEPLDLAGSSISALDLGGEAIVSPSSGGSGSGSLVDFQADEEFQLSPSGVGIEAEDDSGSQVIEVEDSAAFVGDVDFGDAAYGAPAAGSAGLLDEPLAADAYGDGALSAEEVDMRHGGAVGAPVPVAYETPFSVWNVVTLASILVLMCVCGMLMTDLVRNLWAYSETSAPVSSITDALISMVGLDS